MKDTVDQTLRWLSTRGPLVLLEEQHAGHWKGNFGTLAEVPKSTDYARACAVAGLMSRISVGDACGLVFNDDPCDTTIWDEAEATLIVRWVWAPDENAVVRHLRELRPNESYTGCEAVTLMVEEGQMMIFDAIEPGRNVGENCIRFRLRRGTYEVSTRLHRPEAEMFLVLHRFSPIDLVDERSNRRAGD